MIDDNHMLPANARCWLMTAARTPITEVDPLARVKAINIAIRRVKGTYPQLFKDNQNGNKD